MGLRPFSKETSLVGFMVKPKAGLVSIVYYLRSLDYISFSHSIPKFNKAFKNAVIFVLLFPNYLNKSNAAIFLFTESLCFIPSDCAQLKVFLTLSESISNQLSDNFRILHTNNYS
jgi:hypothetical protein